MEVDAARPVDGMASEAGAGEDVARATAARVARLSKLVDPASIVLREESREQEMGS